MKMQDWVIQHPIGYLLVQFGYGAVMALLGYFKGRHDGDKI